MPSNEHAPLNASRRRFLQLAAGGAAAAGLAAVTGPGMASAEDGPPAIPVLIEEIVLAGSLFGGGVLDGVSLPGGDLTLSPGRTDGALYLGRDASEGPVYAHRPALGRRAALGRRPLGARLQ